MLTAVSDDPLFDAASNLSLALLKRICAARGLLENATDLLDVLSKASKNVSQEESAMSSFDRPTPAKVWGVGLLFVTIISCCAAAGIALMPLLSRRTYRRLLIYFIGLGVGSLTGSAVFHLLPQVSNFFQLDFFSYWFLFQDCVWYWGWPYWLLQVCEGWVWFVRIKACYIYQGWLVKNPGTDIRLVEKNETLQSIIFVRKRTFRKHYNIFISGMGISRRWQIARVFESSLDDDYGHLSIFSSRQNSENYYGISQSKLI